MNDELQQGGQGLSCQAGTLSLAPIHLDWLMFPLLPTDFNFSLHHVARDEIHDVIGTATMLNSSSRGSWAPCQPCPPGSFSDRAGSSGCWRCAPGEFAPFWGSTACMTLNELANMPNHLNAPVTCPTGVADCITGEECWTCLSLCCDPCQEYRRRPIELANEEARCGHQGWLNSGSPPSRSPPPKVVEEKAITTPAPTSGVITTTIVNKKTTTAALTTTLAPTTTPVPKECGNARRISKGLQCFSEAFGGTLVAPCATLGQELGDQDNLMVGSDGRLHAIEECDDGNDYYGDGCSGECTIEEGFICTSSSHSSRSLNPHMEFKDEHRETDLRTNRGDFCIPDQPRGLWSVLLERGSLEGI